MSHFLYSLIKFCTGLIFIVVGVAGMLLPWSAAIRTTLVDWILEGSTELMLFGIAFLVIGIYLVIYSLWHSRVRYYKIKLEDPSIMISETLVQDYLSSYWKTLFPLSEIPYRLEMKKKKIAIQADLPSIPEDDQKAILEKIERELSDLFRNLFGYRNRIDITISFKTQKS